MTLRTAILLFSLLPCGAIYHSVTTLGRNTHSNFSGHGPGPFLVAHTLYYNGIYIDKGAFRWYTNLVGNFGVRPWEMSLPPVLALRDFYLWSNIIGP